MTGDTAGEGSGHEALFSVSVGDADRADRVRAAVAREVGEIDDDRSRAWVDGGAGDDRDVCGRDGGAGDATVRVHVDARDVSALRAATGTWLGLLETAGRTAAVAERAGDDREGSDG